MKIIFIITLVFIIGFASEIREFKDNVSGGVLYNRCVPCHGISAEKHVFSTSQVIRGWSSKKIVSSINKYKNNIGNTKYEKIMHGQVEKLTVAEIKLLADYISKL